MSQFALLLLLGLVMSNLLLSNSYAQNTETPAENNAVQAETPTPDMAPPVADLPIAPVAPAVPVAPISPEMTDPLLEGFFEDVGYVPTDKRDPFLPYQSPTFKLAQAEQAPLEPLQKFALNELKLIGIIWDVGKPKALIEDPGGKSHIIIENTKMGNGMGYVAAIREGEIIVVEQLMNAEGKKSFLTKILKLSSIKGIEP